jgi:toxin ParE1/3/4
MKQLPVIYSDDARQDLDVIFAIVLEMSASIRTAENYVRRIEAACRDTGSLPYGGVPRDGIIDGLRIVPFKKRAVIAYIVKDGAVLILKVFYGGEDYQAILRGERPDRWTPQ